MKINKTTKIIASISIFWGALSSFLFFAQDIFINHLIAQRKYTGEDAIYFYYNNHYSFFFDIPMKIWIPLMLFSFFLILILKNENKKRDVKILLISHIIAISIFILPMFFVSIDRPPTPPFSERQWEDQ